LSGAAFINACISMTSTIEVSSTTSKVVNESLVCPSTFKRNR